MKTTILGLFLLFAGMQVSNAQATVADPTEQKIIALSKIKWQWMADKNVDSLSVLFDPKSMFVHMGGSWGYQQEINTIKSGGIHYKKADIESVSAKVIDNTVIVLSKIKLLAVVGGNEVTNPFIVTEVYINRNGRWKLGSLSFTKTMGN
ncbi:MAG: nuclear transport factor 2 family protein [Pedobacter sp.]|nr:MAG: nuclear transport factor 2 family protein [Pedobacter sp.]